MPLRDDPLRAVPLREEPLRVEPLREEPLSPDDADRPRALEPDDDRPLVDPEPDRLRLEPEEDPPLPDPDDDRALAERDCRVPLLALRVLPLLPELRVLPPPLPALDEPPLRDERDFVLV